jgi:hypothetical protein
MAGYTPVFSSMYDGTLFGKWPTAAVWASLLPLLDARGELNMSYEAISARTGWPMDLLKQGISALMQPDPDSQSQAEEGRRLVLLDPARSWGWRAVNHSRYRERARKHNYDRVRVESGDNAERMRRRREAEQRPATTRDDPLSDSDSDSDTNTEGRNKNRREEVSARKREPEQSESKRKPKTRTARAATPLEPEELGQFRFAYPPRAGSQPWRRAIAAIRTRLQEGDSWADIISGAQRYRAFCESTGKVNTEFVMQVATFVGPDRHYLAEWSLPAVAPAKESAEQASLRKLTERRAAIGLADFRAPLPNETSTAYRIAQDKEWDRRRDAKARNAAPVPIETGRASIDLGSALRTMPATRGRT